MRASACRLAAAVAWASVICIANRHAIPPPGALDSEHFRSGLCSHRFEGRGSFAMLRLRGGQSASNSADPSLSAPNGTKREGDTMSSCHSRGSGGLHLSEIRKDGEIRFRTALIKDVVEMQHINLVSLPENYQAQYFTLHILRWPSLSHVAEAWIPDPIRGSNTTSDLSGERQETPGRWRVVGYVLAMCDTPDAKQNCGGLDIVQNESAKPDVEAGLRGHVTSLAVMRSHRRRRIAQVWACPY
jgi:ribosomal protein S18 acetylase RimI-like enzyme